MNVVALKMLFGDRAKYLGIIMGLTFASLLITQQGAIFVGLMTRTYGFITDTGLPDLWVMDPKVQFIDDIKPLQDTELYRVRGVEGVEWAVPLYKGLIKARLEDGTFQTCIVRGPRRCHLDRRAAGHGGWATRGPPAERRRHRGCRRRVRQAGQAGVDARREAQSAADR